MVLIPFFFFFSFPARFTFKQKSQAYINVPVATLWKKPGKKRTIDRHVLFTPVDMNAWTAKMDSVSDRIWLTGKTETQALFGQEVTVLKTSGSWVKIAVKDQFTFKNSCGYPGWIPKSQIIIRQASYSSRPIAIVKSKKAVLTYNKKTSFLEISFNTRFPVIKNETEWVQVMTPSNKTKWLHKKDVVIYESVLAIPKPTGHELVNTGKDFLGLPYLWSGVSAYGFDCSGFTYSIYCYHGINIPRDASEQMQTGKTIEKKQLQPGDLVFFAYNNGKGSVHHVAMYTGNGQIIHAPKAGKKIEIISLDDSPYKEEYAGARRFID